MPLPPGAYLGQIFPPPPSQSLQHVHSLPTLKTFQNIQQNSQMSMPQYNISEYKNRQNSILPTIPRPQPTHQPVPHPQIIPLNSNLSSTQNVIVTKPVNQNNMLPILPSAGVSYFGTASMLPPSPTQITQQVTYQRISQSPSARNQNTSIS